MAGTSPGENLTLSVWLEADTDIDSTNGSRLVEISENANWDTGTGIYFQDGEVFASCTQEGTSTRYGVTSTDAIYEDGAWHHVAYVTDGSTAEHNRNPVHV
ncbi:MAG: LamG domain-containing protein [Holophagales bacterium]|nr:LamG domain-containing protein [Holophagales bacterium]